MLGPVDGGDEISRRVSPRDRDVLAIIRACSAIIGRVSMHVRPSRHTVDLREGNRRPLGTRDPRLEELLGWKKGRKKDR